MKNSLFISGIIILLIFASSNSFGDNQWVSIGPGGVTVKAIAIDPQTPETVYIGTAGFGVFKSIDGGANWILASTGLSSLCVMALVINPQTPETLYAGTFGGGVFGSTDGGMTWTSLSTGLPFLTSVGTLAINLLTPETIFAGTGGFCSSGSNYGDGAFKSIDGGLTWTAISTGLPIPGGVSALAINPRMPDILYAAAFRLVFDSPGGAGVFKSSDGGATWIAPRPQIIPPGAPVTTPPYISALVIDSQTPETIYAGTLGAGVAKSVDGGMTWAAINMGLTNSYVYTLAVNPQTPQTLYAGTQEGVFRSIDAGATWVSINAGLPISTNVWVVAIDPQTPEILYAGTNGFGLFKINGEAGPSNPTLTVSKSGTGNGTVISDRAGISCGATCSESFSSGTVVTLTATADPGSTFVGWYGACSGTGSCSVSMDSDQTLIAVFNLQQHQYVLTVIKSGTGSGMVTSSPTGISCGTNCSDSFSRDQKVRLVAKADAHSTFGGWGSDCSGTGICEVRIESAIVVTATFEKQNISVSPTSIDFGNVKMGKSLKKKLTMTNNGTGDLLVVVGGIEGTDFNISGRANVTVKPNRTINLSVVFRPTSPGPEVTLLKITTNDPDQPSLDIPLSGTGQ